MKFSTRQDTDLSAEALFAAISDFPTMERVLLRRGVQVQRLDQHPQPAIGNAWRLGFDWRGRARDVRIAVSDLSLPESLGFSGASDHFKLLTRLTVVALTRAKSRLIFEVEVQPRGMKARLMLQTARLGKSQLDRKFAERIEEFVSRLAMRAA